MPLPSPGKYKDQASFMHACMSEAYGKDAPKDRTQEQAIAMCMQTWRDAKGGKKPKQAEAEIKRIIAAWKRVLANPAMLKAMEDAPEVEEGESKDDYVSRCVDELTSGDK